MSRLSSRLSSTSQNTQSSRLPLANGQFSLIAGLPLRPTAAGIFWLVAVLALIATAINYGNNLIFALAFLLLALWLQSGWQCRRLMRQVVWRPNLPTSVFVGESLNLTGRLSDGRPDAGMSLTTSKINGCESRFDAAGEALPSLLLPTSRRGELRLDDLLLLSCWPLGLWQARRKLPVLSATIYPHPAGDLPLPAGNLQQAHQQAATNDFQGLRTYMPGDSPRRINWRVFGRRDELAVNRFDGDAGGDAQWLNWEQVSGDGESRVSQLTAWVIAAEHSGREYGLRLPGQSLAPARGRSHHEQLLKLLALFESE